MRPVTAITQDDEERSRGRLRHKPWSIRHGSLSEPMAHRASTPTDIDQPALALAKSTANPPANRLWGRRPRLPWPWHSHSRKATSTLTVLLLLAVITLGGTGCIGRLFDFNLLIVGEQTALERQVLGNYASLGENLMIYSSVRGVDEDGNLRPPPPVTDSQQRAFDAMRNRDYNRDDIVRLLRLSVVGERSDGMIEIRNESTIVPGLEPAQMRAVVAEENADREAILTRLIETTPGADGEEDEVRWIFARLNHDLAPDGAWIQDRSGRWINK